LLAFRLKKNRELILHRNILHSVWKQVTEDAPEGEDFTQGLILMQRGSSGLEHLEAGSMHRSAVLGCFHPELKW
jgi:hypothetical protein